VSVLAAIREWVGNRQNKKMVKLADGYRFQKRVALERSVNRLFGGLRSGGQ